MAIGTDLLSRVKPYTKSDLIRLQSMADAVESIDADNIAGDVVECGVWKGGNIILAKLMSPSRLAWMYDTFDGMTIPDRELDIKRSGERAIDRFNKKRNEGDKWDAISLEEVKSYLHYFKIPVDGVRFIVGPVEETLNESFPKSIALLRLDVDWYLPTKIALEVLYPRLARGGYLIVDDYGHWMGCRKAVDDYFGIQFPFHRDVDYSCRVFRK